MLVFKGFFHFKIKQAMSIVTVSMISHFKEDGLYELFPGELEWNFTKPYL